MRYCGYCGAELPEYARFCRICGAYADGEGKNVVDVINPSPLHVPSPETPLPLFDISLLPSSTVEDVDETMNNTLSAEGAFDLQTWSYQEGEIDDYRTLGSEGIAPLAAGFSQIPASNVPVVPGTPQIGGVPTAGGTPQMGHVPAAPQSPPPAGQAAHELAHQAPASSPQHTWTWEHRPEHPHHQPSHPQHQPLHHPQHTVPPEHHLPAHKPRWWRRSHHSEHQHRQTHSSHAHHTVTATASKATTSLVVKWAIIILAALVVLASGGIIFVLASSPALSLSSSGSVSAGGILQLHGRGFVPGGTITLTVDSGLPVTLAGARPVPGSRSNAGMADLAGLLDNGQAHNSSGAITVGLTGTFDANVVAQASWSAGQHILHAKENTSSRSANVSFTMLAPTARLSVNPPSLDFGIIPPGGRVAESVLIGNTGGSQLTWSATTDSSSSNWLSLQQSSGTLQPNGTQDALYALVNTGTLPQQLYTAQITIHSNAGNAQIAVRMQVGPPVTHPQAKLNANPSTLDFGQLSPGQQVSNTMTIGNQGTQVLQWQASASGPPWLSLSLSRGSVQPGGLPQSIRVTVDTTNSSLQMGSNLASIHISSNGGNATIPVTLTLLSSATPTPTLPPSPSPTLSPPPTTIPSPSPTLSPTTIPSPSPSPSPTTIPSPSPTPSPTVPPSPTPTPVIQAAPGAMDPTSSGCSQNSDGTYTCAVTLSESAPGNLGWFAPTGIGSASITFTPSNGQFTPSTTSQQVTIASIPCANYSFTFTDQNNATATVNWSCQPSAPSPTPTVTPTSAPATLPSGTWNDPGGGASYGTGEPVTIVLTVSGSNVSGTMKGDISGGTTPITGQTGPLSSFSQQDQGFLNYVVQNYGSGTGVFLVYQNTQDFIGAYAGSTYYMVLQSNGTLQGFWYFPNQPVDVGALNFNFIS